MKKNIATLTPSKNDWIKLFNKQIKNEAIILQYYSRYSIHDNNDIHKPYFSANKLFVYMCDPDFIQKYITRKTCPNLTDIFIKCDEYEKLPVKYVHGTSDFRIQLEYAHIKCNQSLNWQKGFYKNDITIIDKIKYYQCLDMYESTEPIINIKLASRKKYLVLPE